MAKEEKTEEAEDGEEGEGGSGKKKMIIIIVGAVLLIAISVGAALFFMGGDDVTEEDAAGEVVEEEVKGDPIYIKIKPAFTVNLDPNDPVGFLQVGIQILTYSEDVGEELTTHMPLIKNNLFTMFGLQKSADLRNAEGKEKLQKEVLETVQDIIDKYGSGGEVENIFFTDFVMQ